jgi:muramoyltetrapeptide carboxypeptidase LdcA involved in peptidoglycan recycling
MQKRIHLTAVGSPAVAELKRLTAGRPGAMLPPDARAGVEDLLALAEGAMGTGYRVTAGAELITGNEDDRKGGREDDAARAGEIESILADDDVAALVTVRGGAWFVRLLDRIDFDVLNRRRRPIYLFGFSEMTPLVGIAGQYPRAIGLYDFGPGFLFGGIKRHVQMNIARYSPGIDLSPEQHEPFAAGWAAARFRRAVEDFFREVAGILEGRAPSHLEGRVPSGRVVAGNLAPRTSLRVVGGNLSLIVPMMGSRYAGAFDTAGKWLAIEDLNELPEQCDRMIAGLKHNGLLERAEGIILGDFHNRDGEFVEAILSLLRYHLPANRELPIVRLDNFGHVWPLAPLPLHRDLILRTAPAVDGVSAVTIEIPWQQWAAEVT